MGALLPVFASCPARQKDGGRGGMVWCIDFHWKELHFFQVEAVDQLVQAAGLSGQFRTGCSTRLRGNRIRLDYIADQIHILRQLFQHDLLILRCAADLIH